MNKVKLKLAWYEQDKLIIAGNVLANDPENSCLYHSEVLLLRSFLGNVPTDFESDKYLNNGQQTSNDLMAIAFAVTMPEDIR